MRVELSLRILLLLRAVTVRLWCKGCGEDNEYATTVGGTRQLSRASAAYAAEVGHTQGIGHGDGGQARPWRRPLRGSGSGGGELADGGEGKLAGGGGGKLVGGGKASWPATVKACWPAVGETSRPGVGKGSWPAASKLSRPTAGRPAGRAGRRRRGGAGR
jgi:hypothetical protein